MIKATQQTEHQPYDVVRQALKEVELDSSRRVELEDYVDVGIYLESLDESAALTSRNSSSPSYASPLPLNSA